MAAKQSIDRHNRGQKDDLGSICPIVGVGASAGGLEAFTKLLRHLPTDTGMAFVLIQHLDPTHASLLTELLARTTLMPVSEVTDGMEVRPDHVYVIPPNAGLVLAGNSLQLVPRDPVRGRYLPVDRFFESLATHRRNLAIAVVLSGTDGDGALGLAAIKATGGITFAQDSATSKFGGMPQQAIATGCVDFVLPPEAIAAELATISRHAYIAELPPRTIVEVLPVNESTLTTIFTLLKTATGLDFTGYKPATLQRRMLRRMALHNLHRVEDYGDYLQRNPAEVEDLYRDLLINVTSFFRDPAAFNTLSHKVFPAILEPRTLGSPLRIWIAGCSTGEEAYSLAICLLEYLAEREIQVPVQIFATDISEIAIDRARSGIYKPSQMVGISAERLRRFFVEVEDGYQISKSVRELCVFAKQNLIADPPFSQLDLISCRNVLIYLGAELQKRLIPIFHYALKPNGFLMLGTSETIGEFSNLFSPIDKKSKLYERKLTPSSHYPMFRSRNPSLEKVKPMMPIDEDNRNDFDLHQAADRIVLSRHAPVGVVINEELNIVQFRGQTGAYLEPAAGKPSFNLFKMAKPDVLVELRATVHQAKQQDEIVRQEGLRLKTDTGVKIVNLEVIPFKLGAEVKRYFLVLFEESEIAVPPPTVSAEVAKKSRQTGLEREHTQLQQELAATRAYLQSMIAEQESVDRAFQVANEEILSSNEELQSTNEELETSQEELQATNEELHTINDELNSRNVELSQIDNDLQNLLSSINISILMLDGELKIRRFTSLAQQVFNLIPTDLGRPFSDIQPNLALEDLGGSIQATIDTLIVTEQEVQDRTGHWYSLRIRPYRTLDHRIDGVVIGLIDINNLKRSAMQIAAARDYANAIVETVRQPLIVLTADFRVIRANQYFYNTFEISPTQTEQQSIFELGNGVLNLPSLRSLLETILSSDTEFHDFEVTQTRSSQPDRIFLLNARKIIDDFEAQSILLAIEDISERRQAESQIQSSLVEKEVLLREIHHRVTNNLQIISSLLSLQSNRIVDPQLHEILQDSHNRVRAMALIHEILYQSSNLAALNFTEYIQTLAKHLFDSYTVDRSAISLRVEVQSGVTINVDKAVLCGLIINELVANALKHGFPDRDPVEPIRGSSSTAPAHRGEVVVTLGASGEDFLTLSVANNGQSLPADFDINHVRSMGLTLVLSLIKQIKGNLEVETGEMTVFKIILPIYL
jgi:two-component system, chemotaxis family, CheB/CheR fusion protein